MLGYLSWRHSSCSSESSASKVKDSFSQRGLRDLGEMAVSKTLYHQVSTWGINQMATAS